MIQPLDTSLLTVDKGVFTAFAIIVVAMVVPVEAVVSRTFFILVTIGRSLLRVNRLANVT